MTIGGLELAEIACNALFQLCTTALHLTLREVAVAIVDRLELAAVNGNARRREQAQLAAQLDEACADLAYISITTTTFVTEVGSADLRRIGTSVSERVAFTLDNTPETTKMTVVSEPRYAIVIRSFMPTPPDYGVMWYSVWDLRTAAPLIDRMRTFDPLVEFVAISFRFSDSGRYLAFTKGLYELEGQPVSWIELTPPREVSTWLPDLAEALVNSRLTDEGISEPVSGQGADHCERGIERLKRLSAN